MDAWAGGIITAVGILFILVKMDSTWLRRMLAFDLYIDAIITIGLVVLLKDTLGGLQTAMLSGAILSVILLAAKMVLGYEKAHITNGELVWVRKSFWRNTQWVQSHKQSTSNSHSPTARRSRKLTIRGT